LRIGCDSEHPLAAHHLHDFAAAALAAPVHDLLVGEADLAGGAEIDGDLGFIREAFLIQFEEDPLRPPVIIRVGGADLAAPVERVTQALELARKRRMFSVVTIVG